MRFTMQFLKKLAEPAFLPRALFDRFNIEVLATTEDPLDDLSHHQSIRSSGWTGRVITTYRPDNVIDPEHTGFAQNVENLGILTKCDTPELAGIFASPSPAPGVFPQLWGNGNRSWASDCTHRKSFFRGRCGFV